MGKLVLFALVLGLQVISIIACGRASSKRGPNDPDEDDSLEEYLWSIVCKALAAGKMLKAYAEIYYEEYIKHQN